MTREATMVTSIAASIVTSLIVTITTCILSRDVSNQEMVRVKKFCQENEMGLYIKRNKFGSISALGCDVRDQK